MYKRILVATDGSTLSKKAVASAIDLAALSGAELVAVKVVPRYPQSYFEGSLPLGPQEVAKIERQWATEAQASVDLVKKQGEAKGVKVKATKPETITEPANAKANSVNNLPVRPGVKAKGA